jgi:hypothetical protein
MLLLAPFNRASSSTLRAVHIPHAKDGFLSLPLLVLLSVVLTVGISRTRRDVGNRSQPQQPRS